jgi:hypothetical protein
MPGHVSNLDGDLPLHVLSGRGGRLRCCGRAGRRCRISGGGNTSGCKHEYQQDGGGEREDNHQSGIRLDDTHTATMLHRD